jgi:peptidoglycan/LPS O-acetylase OafA/YrhL
MGHGIMIQPYASLPFPVVDGVELFFVLSGFLIGSILIRTIEKEERFGLKSLLHFWKRRWFRTLPNYYLILLINVILVYYEVINGDLEQFGWSFVFFSHNLYNSFHSFFWESWSLSVEEWFYIVLPLSVIFFRVFLSKQNTLLATIGLLILAPILYRISQSGVKVDGYGLDVEFRKVVVMRLDAIIYGVLAAYIKFYHGAFWSKSRWIAFVLGFVIIYTSIYIPKEPNDFFTKTLNFTLLSIGAMCLLPLADSIKSYRFKWLGHAVTHISKISYSMYLVNLALVAQVIMKNFRPETNQEAWLLYSVFWTVTIGLSTFLYYFFEKPMMSLRDRI